MCQQCDGFKERVEVDHPYEYYSLARQLRELVSKGMFLVHGEYHLDEIQEGKPWPADVVTHSFVCTRCKSCFTLSVDTYHGSGSWESEDL